jgi:hypothetical protein
LNNNFISLSQASFGINRELSYVFKVCILFGMMNQEYVDFVLREDGTYRVSGQPTHEVSTRKRILRDMRRRAEERFGDDLNQNEFREVAIAYIMHGADGLTDPEAEPRPGYEPGDVKA